jgi:hypothetical protein
MTGKIIKTEQGWMVSRCVGDGVPEVWEEKLPLHLDDLYVIDHTGYILGERQEVEFEIVKIWERNTDRGIPTFNDFKHYAKLIPSKEQQKQETLYTEEQVREVIGRAQLLNHNDEFAFTEEYLIQSLKQPKKD